MSSFLPLPSTSSFTSSGTACPSSFSKCSRYESAGIPSRHRRTRFRSLVCTSFTASTSRSHCAAASARLTLPSNISLNAGKPIASASMSVSGGMASTQPSNPRTFVMFLNIGCCLMDFNGCDAVSLRASLNSRVISSRVLFATATPLRSCSTFFCATMASFPPTTDCSMTLNGTELTRVSSSNGRTVVAEISPPHNLFMMSHAEL
mmetsp:Transcript_66202/g.137947  ORF Transcript_66202/g.137947 Transcript_66202/m.137947 type:complete len:205 (+) Transcript_66202:225-839(+)